MYELSWDRAGLITFPVACYVLMTAMSATGAQ